MGRACRGVRVADGRLPAVYAKLRNTVKDTDWNPEVEEEFEDSEGNVMNKKVRRPAGGSPRAQRPASSRTRRPAQTYYDLARQGLL